jgi:uncharacterized protein YdeI (YjbR/CyaY-like superfamily)
MTEQEVLPVLLFEERDDWAEWLYSNPEAKGVWLKFAKKATGVKSINYDQALEVALCYGWIDGQAKRFDEKYYLQRMTPRRAKSNWSARNCRLAEELIRSGKMQPGGQREVNQAKVDGRWDAAYESPAKAEIPQDFLDALAKNKTAEAFYRTLNKANSYAIYYRLHTAKKPETRSARIEKLIAMLAEGRKLH